MTTATFGVIALSLLVGATMQSTVGLGVALVAAPVTTLLEPELMPGVLLMLSLLMPCLTLAYDHHDIDWGGLVWALPPRVFGTVGGVLAVATFSHRQLGVAVGLVVLAAALLTWRTVTVPVNRLSLAAAGLVSGVTGTATSIGGPPLAILYQHRPPAQARPTLAVYFLVGAGLSLIALLLSGDLSTRQLRVAVELVPVLAAGAGLGVLVRHRLPLRLFRPAVLVVSSASAVVLVARSLVG